MGASLLIGLIKKYASKGLIVLMAVLLAAGIYLHWKSDLIDEGRQIERKVWEKREAKIKADGDKLLARRQLEFDEKAELNREIYLNAIKQYAQNAQDVSNQLAAANRRMYVRTKSCNRDAVPAAGGSTGSTSRTNKDVYQVSELDDGVREDLRRFAAQVELGKRDCALLVNLIEQQVK